jgi:predicted RNase H-like HicB family nuclease
MTRKFVVVIEKGDHNFGAYVPDLPGCVTTAKSAERAMRNIRQAIEFHLDGLARDGEPIPEPSSLVCEVEVSVPPRRRKSA